LYTINKHIIIIIIIIIIEPRQLSQKCSSNTVLTEWLGFDSPM